MTEIASLETVDAHEVWADEAGDFTPWLFEHPEYLGQALGLDLEMEGREVDVGTFRVDLLAREVGTGKRVVVENQLESTNHGHLGQLLTYASGLEASYVVWVSTAFRPEHVSALRWLNENSHEDVAFFGLEIEVIRIETSRPAVRLKPVAYPDSWSRETRSGAELTPKEKLYLEFWTQFIPELHERHPAWTRTRAPQKASWLSLPAGRTGIGYSVNFAGNQRVRAELYVDPSDESLRRVAYEQLKSNKSEIERSFGEPLSWEALEGRRASRIATYTAGSVEERERWPEVGQWLLESVGRLREALQPFVDRL